VGGGGGGGGGNPRFWMVQGGPGSFFRRLVKEKRAEILRRKKVLKHRWTSEPQAANETTSLWKQVCGHVKKGTKKGKSEGADHLTVQSIKVLGKRISAGVSVNPTFPITREQPT